MLPAAGFRYHRPMGFRAASAAEIDLWKDMWQARIAAWYGRFGYSDSEIVALISPILARHDDLDHAAVTALTGDGGSLVGFLAVSLRANASPVVGVIDDIWVDPAHRRVGIGRAAVAHAIASCRPRAAQLELTNDPEDSSAMSLFEGYPVRSRAMRKALSVAPEIDEGLIASPLAEHEFPAWRVTEVDMYASNIVGSGALSPTAAKVLSEQTYAELLPDGLATAHNSFWTIEDGVARSSKDQRYVAAVWVRHRSSHDVSDVFAVTVADGMRGRGYGRAAMLVAERAALAAGNSHIALNVFSHNTPANMLYRKLGYRCVSERRFVDL
jgi:ribosomal protein S18 acetylase RimI-like enzyme